MTTQWPDKTGEQRWVVWDTARWNGFEFRDDDIVICTYSKSGTTWMQQIVAQLVFRGDPEIYGQALSPWIEFRLVPHEEALAEAAAQTHRRFLKTHSPLHTIPFPPEVKYIFVGRDARDVVWSMYHHHTSFTPEAYEAFNSVPGRIGPPMAPPGCDVRAYYHAFLDREVLPGFETSVPFWSHVQGFWDARHLPNLSLVHYANLKADLAGEARRIAEFLEIDLDESLWPKVVEHCSLEHMRELASRWEMLDQLFEGGGRTFINKGMNGRWKAVLTPEEIAKCDDVAARRLTPDCAHWLRSGELTAQAGSIERHSSP